MLDDQVAALADQPRQAGALGAEHEADALGGQVAEVEQRPLGGVVEADDPDPRARLSRASAAGSPATSAIGTCSTAPAAALATVGVTCTARWRGSRTPSTPAPSQLRRIAPRLPGSVTPSTATRNGARPAGAAIRSAKLGLGERRGEGDDALRRLAAGPGLELACAPT